MKVEGPKSAGSVSQAKRARPASGAGAAGEFASELDKVTDADEPTAAPVEGAGGIVGIGGILAAQSVNDQNSGPGERRRRAQRAADLLDRLDEIRRGLLRGAIPKERLAELVRLVREKRERGADPIISRLLDEIELRASVELAKLGLPVG